MGLMDKARDAAKSTIGVQADAPQQVQYQQPVQQIGERYVVLQVTLKEKLIGSGSGNLAELEKVINQQAAQGYRLHTFSTATSGSGHAGGDRIQATLVFEREY